MINDNFWGFDNCYNDEPVSTDRIIEIMNKQCRYLYEYTQGKVFAIFDVVKREGALFSVIKKMSEVSNSVSGSVQEKVGEKFSNELVDASDIYYEKEYGFEIYTDTYRYRLFSLNMASIYPVTMKIEEVVYGHIENELRLIGIKSDKEKNIVIDDEESFCDVLKLLLQDKKVRYIISELKKRALSENDMYGSNKIIVCEGRTDDIIIQAIAEKLNCVPRIVIAGDKNKVPDVVASVKKRNTNAQVLVIIDSDGEEVKTRELVEKIAGKEGYELAIVKNQIEDWFMPEVKNFSKLKLIQTIDDIIDKVDFDELSKEHESFYKLIDFLKK